MNIRQFKHKWTLMHIGLALVLVIALSGCPESMGRSPRSERQSG